MACLALSEQWQHGAQGDVGRDRSQEERAHRLRHSSALRDTGRAPTLAQLPWASQVPRERTRDWRQPSWGPSFGDLQPIGPGVQHGLSTGGGHKVRGGGA